MLPLFGSGFGGHITSHISSQHIAYLIITSRQRKCADLMGNSITIDNVASILQAADTYQETQLRTKCISFMVEHFAEVVKTESFKELIATPTRPLVLMFLEETASRMRLPSHTAMGSEG